MVSERLHNPGEQVAADDIVLELFDPRSLYVWRRCRWSRRRSVHPGTAVEVISGGGALAARGVAVVVRP